jgi:iron complex transport system substrate-binding protein
LPEGVFFWDGSTEGVLSMLYVAKQLYPTLFEDLDLKHEIRGYYARFYRYALSDRGGDWMLQGRGPDGRRRNDLRN